MIGPFSQPIIRAVPGRSLDRFPGRKYPRHFPAISHRSRHVIGVRTASELPGGKVSQVLLNVHGAGGAGTVLLGLGSAGLVGALPIYIHYRARLQLERERSRRARFRSLVIARAVAGLRPGTRLLERDADGHMCVIDCAQIRDAGPARDRQGGKA
jgi:hypothetical protein